MIAVVQETGLKQRVEPVERGARPDAGGRKAFESADTGA